MATRSGRRIHSSFGNLEQPDLEKIVKSERKTRSKRQKENCDEVPAVLKKKAHYVHYPGDEIFNDANENVIKSTRKLRRHTLKEQNIITNSENSNDNIEVKKHTRRPKKFVEEIVTDVVENNDPAIDENLGNVIGAKQKIKKNKKKKQNVVTEPTENYDEVVKETVLKTKKKSKKKKSSKLSNSTKVEDLTELSKNTTLNNSIVSNESFHSAAGSPGRSNMHIGIINDKSAEVEKSETVKTEVLLRRSNKKSLTPKLTKSKNSTFVKDSEDECGIFIDAIEKQTKIKRKLSVNEITPGKTNNDSITNELPKLNGSLKKKLDSTFEKISPDSCDSRNINTDIEKLISSSERKSLRLLSQSGSGLKRSLNSTFEKLSDKPKLNRTKSLDSTFDKEGSIKLNSTYDKDQRNSNQKSDAINVTFDKANNSHISINSDDSKTENIINLTPELVESSIDESSIQKTPKNKVEEIVTENISKVPITPLKREGTFTMESTNVMESPKYKGTEIPTLVGTDTPKPKISVDRTPNRRKSMPSPGCTPFPVSKSSQKEKSVLNVTRSIEKSLRRSSVTEPISRTTKVMFCSPVNNCAVASQIKRKVIKSNLKGSNKSFVFDESLSEGARPAARKRSYTQSDVEDVRVKRSRLGEELQQSVDRLSRPRTFSAAAKLSEPSTPSKKTATPSKTKPENKVTRTKLPNFAALHQKRFEKMESLDECQERKAKRARQLLTPTGSVNLIERISPKENVAESPKKASAKEPRKPDTPFRPKLPTLESLNPGYTRFGFKMNCDVNPFSVPSKTKVMKAKETKPNGVLTRQATLPSLTGVTSVRKQAAKLTVMREKSFTEKRDINRKENRTVIKGVRTNRRFELQMKMRNLNS
ncbi:unnamed protein product [Parnassius mnemosyne]|uniref:Uncharacterized protein n=1 Tax=Parnassius mnemosyne TaxID=213953 RepID=A0AAV1KNQ3_9NEOP